MNLKKKPALKSVSFNKETGLGKIVISGKLLVRQGVDDPVIEIWNAVQLKMQTAILNTQGRELIYFTPLFPTYNEAKDETIYELAPTKPAGVPIKRFLSNAEKTLDIFYKNLFKASFCQFLNDENDICNYNGYSLYSECMKRIAKEKDPKKRDYDIRTIRMLLEDFICFLSLPLPKSKEECERRAALLTLQQLDNSTAEWGEAFSFAHNPEKISKLITA